MNQCHIGLDALNDIVFGLLPKFVAGPCAQFCTKVFVPHLARLASEVVIPKPVMLVLRSSAFGIGMFFHVLDLGQLLAEIWSKARPIFEHDEDEEEGLRISKSYKAWKEAYDAKRHGLLREYEHFHDGYKHLYFLYRPVAQLVIFDAWWMTHPLWSRLDRFENYQVRTLRKHDKWKGRRVILGGTRIRYPGRAGAELKIETGLAYFGMGFTAHFFMGFATGNLYIFGWRV